MSLAVYAIQGAALWVGIASIADKSLTYGQFFQFWFLPGILTAFCVLFYPASYRARKRKDRARRDDEREPG